jgi:hypothetical protein
MIRIPLSLAGSAEAFAAAVAAHRAALEAHRLGPAGVAVPIAHELVEALIACVPDSGPVAERGPDRFEIVPYEIFDDTPVAPETQQALDVLRETLSG